MKRNLTREITEDGLGEVYKTSHGIPFYVHLLGKRLQQSTEKIDSNEVAKQFSQLIEEEGTIIFRSDFENLSPKQRLVVAVMALKNISVLSEIAEAAKISHGSIGTIIRQLEGKGVVRKIDSGKYEIGDHFFKTWLAKRYADDM